MEQSGIEEGGVALRERQLDVMLVEVVLELGAACRKVSRRIGLRERQVQGRSRLDRHVAMGDRALQRQHRRELMNMSRELLASFRGLEAEMIVAVRPLRLAARIDHIELRRDLVGWAKPSLADQRNDIIAVVRGESFWIA